MTTDTAIRYFIAVPASDQGVIVAGIGTSEAAAIQDAHEQSQTRAATVGQDDEGDWVVSYDGTYEAFRDEGKARNHAAGLGFVARECTERLYLWIKDHGAPADAFSWAQPGFPLIDDLDVDQDLVDEAVAEVDEGFDGSTADGGWTVADALSDAHAYVDAYVMDDEGVDQELKDSIAATAELRLAIDLGVRDLIFSAIAGREAA